MWPLFDLRVRDGWRRVFVDVVAGPDCNVDPATTLPVDAALALSAGAERLHAIEVDGHLFVIGNGYERPVSVKQRDTADELIQSLRFG